METGTPTLKTFTFQDSSEQKFKGLGRELSIRELMENGEKTSKKCIDLEILVT